MRRGSIGLGAVGFGALWHGVAWLGTTWADNSSKHRVRCLGKLVASRALLGRACFGKVGHGRTWAVNGRQGQLFWVALFLWAKHMADETTKQPGISAREKAALALMAVGFVSFVGGIACISLPWAAIVGGALLLTAGVVADRMS